MNLSPTSMLMVMAGAALLPFALVVLTCFVKMAVVLSVARTAIGAPQLPPNSVITGLAMVLSVVVMAPVAGQVYERFKANSAGWESSNLAAKVKVARQAAEPLRQFLLRHSNPDHVRAVASASGKAEDDGSWSCLVAGFVITQLHQAFRIGFYIFLPFLVLDMLVASVLLSLGMHMLNPTVMSLPLKLLLFVVANGWEVLGANLLGSYHA
ncbi:MAG: flagellar biosynthetic protein FliP [Deltaproteobacteria bacterium]|nr:MAG: flagellar biosynthetic protein FliP [Deltaproteobacteria bacterium]